MRGPAILAASLVMLLAASSVRATDSSEPIVTNKQRFRIPYQSDPAELSRLGAKEIRLYLSRDRGQTWQQVQSVAPEAGRFDFQANQDGEYWFSVRTVDRRGELHPPGATFEPGLRVVIDAKAPNFHLELRQLQPGKVQLSWTAADPHLDLERLRLEYRQQGMTEWQHVSIRPQPQGQTAWTVRNSGVVSVRGYISDTAGNTATTEAQQFVAVGPAYDEQPDLDDRTQPIAQSPLGTLAAGPTLGSAPGLSPMNTGSYSPQPAASPTMSSQTPTPAMWPSQFVSEPTANRPSIAQGRYPAVTPAETFMRAGNDRKRTVRTRRFQIGYKVDDVGPSGVGAVELYITDNGGGKWWKYGEDTDHVSPVDVEVPSDGEYGFAIRVKSGAGLSLDPPSIGEAPAVVVVVDQTPPVVRLEPVQQGQGAAANQLLIRWTVSEINPADKGVALFYAGSPTGPWEPLSGWRDDTGSYVWTVGPGVPTQLYVRVAARDVAGNTAAVETNRPIVVDLARPSARIVDVEAGSQVTPR